METRLTLKPIVDQIAWTLERRSSRALDQSDRVRVKVFYREAEMRSKV